MGILAILVGVFAIAGEVALLPTSVTTTMSVNGTTMTSTTNNPSLIVLSVVALIVGILYVVSGVGFLQGYHWAWTIGIIVSILSLIRNVLEAIQGLIVLAVPGGIVAAFIIYYLTRPHVKSFFSPS